jgi:hypothetical protein
LGVVGRLVIERQALEIDPKQIRKTFVLTNQGITFAIQFFCGFFESPIEQHTPKGDPRNQHHGESDSRNPGRLFHDFTSFGATKNIKPKSLNPC